MSVWDCEAPRHRCSAHLSSALNESDCAEPGKTFPDTWDSSSCREECGATEDPENKTIRKTKKKDFVWHYQTMQMIDENASVAAKQLTGLVAHSTVVLVSIARRPLTLAALNTKLWKTTTYKKQTKTMTLGL
jgi:hypothetical protein